MNEKNPTYRVEIINNGIPLDGTYGWKIYRNRSVLPVLRSEPATAYWSTRAVAHFGHAGKSSANRGKDRGCRPPSCATKARSREN